MRHDGHLVQRGLAVEQQHVAVVEVPLHHVTVLELARDAPAVAVLEVLGPAGFESHKVCPGVLVHPVANALADHLDVVPGHNLRVGHHLRDVHRHPDLVDAQVGIGRDDRAAAEVDALAGEVSSKTTLLALEPLHEPPQGLTRALVLRGQTRKLGVDVHRALDLQKIPVLHQVVDREALLEPLPQHVVHLDDLYELHGDVVLVAPSLSFHLHAGADAHGRDRQVGEDEVLRSVGYVQQLAVHRRDLREDRLYADGVEVVLNPRQVRLELVVVLHRLLELFHVRLHQLRVFAVLLVHDLQAGARAFHHAVCRAAVGADPAPLALVRELLRQRAFGDDLEPRVTEALQVLLALLLREHHATALLAHLLEDGDYVLEVADVKDGQLELHVAEVPGAVDELALARRALRSSLIRGPHARIQDAVLERDPLGHLIQVALEHVKHTALSYLLRGHQREAHAADLARGVQLVERRLAELQRLGIVPTLLGAVARSGGRHGPSYVTAPSTNQLARKSVRRRHERKRPPMGRAPGAAGVGR
mmetsp:Transcript_13597/g.53664  ORF Transcript_13597/g.53664 Transcript_13597/m.53664 type:complete len:532 (-) Transcript_13597:120-1715(-)